MSAPATPPLTPTALVSWDDPQRQAAFHRWLDGIAPAHRLLPDTVRLASADASFRRYLRIDADATRRAHAASSWTRRPRRKTAPPSCKVARADGRRPA